VRAADIPSRTNGPSLSIEGMTLALARPRSSTRSVVESDRTKEEHVAFRLRSPPTMPAFGRASRYVLVKLPPTNSSVTGLEAVMTTATTSVIVTNFSSRIVTGAMPVIGLA